MIWDQYLRFRDRFAEAMDPALYSISYLDSLIYSGLAFFWSTEQAAIIAEIRHYPTGATDIHGLIAAGDMDDIVNVLIPQAEAWAKAHGCVGAIIESREGWGRVLKARGYEPHQLTVRKVL